MSVGETNDVSHAHDVPIWARVALQYSKMQVFYPLNGSSEDRQDARAHHEQIATALMVPCRSATCLVMYGGGSLRGRCGVRYLTWSERGNRCWDWFHWRRAKRLVRKTSHCYYTGWRP